jgi:hypothetical protein
MLKLCIKIDPFYEAFILLFQNNFIITDTFRNHFILNANQKKREVITLALF